MGTHFSSGDGGLAFHFPVFGKTVVLKRWAKKTKGKEEWGGGGEGWRGKADTTNILTNFNLTI